MKMLPGDTSIADHQERMKKEIETMMKKHGKVLTEFQEMTAENVLDHTKKMTKASDAEQQTESRLDAMNNHQADLKRKEETRAIIRSEIRLALKDELAELKNELTELKKNTETIFLYASMTHHRVS